MTVTDKQRADIGRELGRYMAACADLDIIKKTVGRLPEKMQRERIEVAEAAATTAYDAAAALIRTVADALPRQILYRRYLQGRTIIQIAADMGYDRTTVHRMHKKALTAIAAARAEEGQKTR